MFQTIMLHIVLIIHLVVVIVKVHIHLHGGVSTIINSIHVLIRMMRHVIWQQSALVQVSSLIYVFLSAGVELDHHGTVHLGSGDIHGSSVDVVESHDSCLGVALGRLRIIIVIHLEHVLISTALWS